MQGILPVISGYSEKKEKAMHFGAIIVVGVTMLFLILIAIVTALSHVWPLFGLSVILIAGFLYYAIKEFMQWRKK